DRVAPGLQQRSGVEAAGQDPHEGVQEEDPDEGGGQCRQGGRGQPAGGRRAGGQGAAGPWIPAFAGMT
ncbi:MAG: hypothetical protein OXI26_01370, partial [bacterium]|nr:hypothetical protein [bacterium]